MRSLVLRLGRTRSSRGVTMGTSVYGHSRGDSTHPLLFSFLFCIISESVLVSMLFSFPPVMFCFVYLALGPSLLPDICCVINLHCAESVSLACRMSTVSLLLLLRLLFYYHLRIYTYTFCYLGQFFIARVHIPHTSQYRFLFCVTVPSARHRMSRAC